MKGEVRMLKNEIKKVLKDKKGAVNTIEIIGWVAVVSIVLVVVITSLQPRITGNNGILDNSIDRIADVEDIITNEP